MMASRRYGSWGGGLLVPGALEKVAVACCVERARPCSDQFRLKKPLPYRQWQSILVLFCYIGMGCISRILEDAAQNEVYRWLGREGRQNEGRMFGWFRVGDRPCVHGRIETAPCLLPNCIEVAGPICLPSQFGIGAALERRPHHPRGLRVFHAGRARAGQRGKDQTANLWDPRRSQARRIRLHRDVP